VTDPLSEFAKRKKKSGLPKPEKVSTHFTASSTTATLQKPQRNHAQRVRAPQVKPVVKPIRNQAHRIRTQAYRNEDFQFTTSIDQLGVNILVTFQGTHLY